MRPAIFRPRRALLVPFVATFAPLLWFVARDVSATDGATTASVPRFVGLASVAVVASYLVAVLVVGLASRAARPSRASDLMDPGDGTLAVFAAFVVVGVGYLVASTFVAIPRWFDLVATPVGLLLGLPLVGLYGGFVAVGNVFPALQQGVVPFAAVAVGLVLSVCWTFLLSTLLAAKLGWL